MWVDSLICMNIQQNPAKCWHIIMKSSGGIVMVAKFMLFDNGTLCISSQIHIKATYVIPRKNAIHLTETESGNVSQKRGEKKKERQREDRI